MMSYKQLLLGILAVLALSFSCSACEVDLSIEFSATSVLENITSWNESSLDYNGTYWNETNDEEFNTTTNATAVTCPCSPERPCIRKCCAYHQVMVDLECSVDENGEYEGQWFRPEVSDDGNTTWEVGDGNHFHVVIARPCDGHSLHPEVEGNDGFYIRSSDGKLCIKGGNVTCLDVNEFCLDFVPDAGFYLPYVCTEAEVQQEVQKVEVVTFYEPLFDYIFVASISISIIFLGITFMVYAFIPELRSLPGKCHMCHVFSVFAYNSIHLVFSVLNTVFIRHPAVTCFVIDIPNYFFYFTSFSWLNVICFDICMAFIELRPLASPLRYTEKKRFIKYSVYAWSAPFLVFAACAALESLTLTQENPTLTLGTLCSEPTISYSWLYHIAPMSVLMICNVILFIITAVNLYRAKRATTMLSEADSRRHAGNDEQRKQRFKMYLKLLIVMGLNWSVEPVYWTIHSWVSTGFTPFLWKFLHTMVIISYLQGFFIFLIFVCNDRVIRLVRVKFFKISRSSQSLTQVTTMCFKRKESSSQGNTAIMRY